MNKEKMKEMYFGDEARKKLLQGLMKLKKAVTVTLGPIGKNVLIQRNYQPVHSTKDGITVAKEVNLEDPVEQTAVELVRQAASNTVREVGDGTTTSTLLAANIIQDALEQIEEHKLNSTVFARGMLKAAEVVSDRLDKEAKPLEGFEQIKQVATVAANNDPVIGDIVAKAMEQVGIDGKINVTKSLTSKTYLKRNTGVTFNRGYLSDLFINKKEKKVCEYKDTNILLLDGDIVSLFDFERMMQVMSQTNEAFLIVCNDIGEDILNLIIRNRIKNRVRIVVVNAPSFGAERSNILDDISVITGAIVVEDLSLFKKEDLGRCKYMTVDAVSTTLIGGEGDKQEIKERVDYLKSMLKEEKNKEALRDRIAQLNDGISTLFVGGSTETEVIEKTDRVDDSVQATKIAMKEGVVKGGGYALLDVAEFKFDDVFKADDRFLGERSFMEGFNCVIRALGDPFGQILSNAGEDWDKIEVIRTVYVDEGLSLNPLTGEAGDFFEMGIIDPVGVVKSAVTNAVSVASNFITTECVIPVKQVQNQQLNPYDYVH